MRWVGVKKSGDCHYDLHIICLLGNYLWLAVGHCDLGTLFEKSSRTYNTYSKRSTIINNTVKCPMFHCSSE